MNGQGQDEGLEVVALLLGCGLVTGSLLGMLLLGASKVLAMAALVGLAVLVEMERWPWFFR